MNKSEKGFSIIELMVTIAVLLILLTIIIPRLLQARIIANEASAIVSMRSIVSAEQTYREAYPMLGYSADLPSLGGPQWNCAPSSSTACLLDASLSQAVSSSNAKSGYWFTYSATSNSSGLGIGFVLNATPAISGSTGTRGFFVDETGLIRGQNGMASANSFPVNQ